MMSLWHPRRTLMALTLAVGSSACAAHAGAGHLPSPFPTVSAPTGITPDPGAPPRRIRTQDVLRTALSYQGAPYRWGGESPTNGFDCSGFIKFVLAQNGYNAPRTTGEQYRMGTRIDFKHIRAGDLVFFSTVAPGASHVGLAISAEEFVHAPASNGVVRTERVSASYWKSRFVGARRILPTGP